MAVVEEHSTGSIVRGVCHHDCPDSCAWEVTVESDAGTGARRAIKLRGAPDHPFTRGELCPKVNRFLDRVYHPDRVLHPLIRTGAKGAGQFRQASWEEAIDRIRDGLNAAIERHGRESVLPFSYAGTQGLIQMASMSERFFNRLGATAVTGGLCGTVARLGLSATQGADLGIDPEDVRHAEVVVIWSNNTLLTNRHLWPFVEEAKANGAEVICIDPIRTATAAAADWHVQLLPGTDSALALGMLHVIVRDDLVDHDYVGDHTAGFDDLAVRAKEFPPERVAEICGLRADDVERLARAYATARPAAIRLLIGMEHRQHGAMAYRAIACLPAVTGQWRHRGGGLVRSTGPLFGELLDSRLLERPDLAPGPRRTIDMGRLGAALTDADLDPPITALVVYDCNPAVIVPNQAKVLEGLAREDLFTVVLEQFVNDTARFADVVLPATTQIEHLDLVAPWGHLYLTLNEPAIEPVGEALPNTEVFRRLATAMGFDDPAFGDSDEDMIRQVLAASDHPFMDGITFEALRDRGSQRLRVPDDWRPFAAGGFPTVSGKVELRSERLAAAGLDPLPTWTPAREGPHGDPDLLARFPLVCMTLKRQVRFLNSSYGHLRAHRRAEGEPLLEISSSDAEARGIGEGARVRVWNDRGSLVLGATISDRVRPGLVAVPFGWALDAAAGGGCNVLTNDATTDLGRSAAFHDNLVEVAPAEERAPSPV